MMPQINDGVTYSVNFNFDFVSLSTKKKTCKYNYNQQTGFLHNPFFNCLTCKINKFLIRHIFMSNSLPDKIKKLKKC